MTRPWKSHSVTSAVEGVTCQLRPQRGEVGPTSQREECQSHAAVRIWEAGILSWWLGSAFRPSPEPTHCPSVGAINGLRFRDTNAAPVWSLNGTRRVVHSIISHLSCQ